MALKPMSKKLKGFGRFVWRMKAARFYHNGDGAGLIWNWWNPIAWPLAACAFIASCVFEGVPATWRNKHDIGFGMDPWFIKNPDKLEWE